MTYLRRNIVGQDVASFWEYFLSLGSLFDGVDGVEYFNPFYLLTNIVSGILINAAIIALLGARHRRRSLSTLHLSDMLVLVGVVAVLTSAVVYVQEIHRNELSILSMIEESNVDWHAGGPSWLRHLIGSQPFRILDRVADVGCPLDCNELVLVSKLRKLKVVALRAELTCDLRRLENLAEIEALDLSGLSYNAPNVPDDLQIELPVIPRLRGLNLRGLSWFRGHGLANFPSLEVLDVSGTQIDDTAIDELTTLAKLRILNLESTLISPDGVNKVRESLPTCKIIEGN